MTLDTLFKKAFSKKSDVNWKSNLDDTTDDDTSVGINSLVNASVKLLNVNKGLTEPDERDSLRFKEVYNTDNLIEERIKLDAGKLKNTLMFKLAKLKSLKNFPSGYFDSYASGHIVGNSLSSPSEEINPIQVLDQSYRMTQMGDGGIGSESAITVDAQNVHPSQFGFIDTVATPESIRAGIDARFAWKTRIGTDGKLYTKVKDIKNNKYVWLTPEEIEDSVVAFPQ